ncbi:polysaccharide deacetylase family protein [Alicyclobacillus shizuokensis]|uniref:polysaccharide deacetylase family protein n=1 Tax=Alicyclobacillus shizuokensis TaxID=392014 RepID=UPI0008363DFF|nr:polysaccharide deacetylase family protein [Alicyclobacillus shizuokensis]MCL6624974.1 polysaccharide deacetylase family protein [Alicyclobacillus shizuokensis]
MEVNAHSAGQRRRGLALTFDDGPDEEYTPFIIDILNHYRIPAIFFCLGQQVEKYPDVLRRMANTGHTVGNHSWSHPDLTKLSADDVCSELMDTDAVIRECLGVSPRFVRPPYGSTHDALDSYIRSLGFEVVLWDIDSHDWTGIPGSEIARNVVPRLRPGSIILQHCSGRVKGTTEALPYIIEIALGMGYTFTSLEHIIGSPPYRH